MSRTDAHTPWHVVPPIERLQHWINRCGCSMCTGRDEARYERRWWRHEIHQQLHDARKVASQDRDEIDPFPRCAIQF